MLLLTDRNPLDFGVRILDIEIIEGEHAMERFHKELYLVLHLDALIVVLQ